MARRRRQAGWADDDRDNQLNSMFGAMRDTAQQALGSEVSIGSEAGENLVGLPLPALCLRYLFQSSTFPLSRIVQVTGQEGSCKSAFLFEIMRWHMVYGGGAFFMENENKDSPELRQGIFEYNPNWEARCCTDKTYALEEWQEALTTFIKVCRDSQDAADGPGRTVPICFGIDSIMATATREEIAAVVKAGSASRGYAVAANLIARYMRTLTSQIKQYPFTIVGTNHLKPSTDARGLPTNNIPGGKAVQFMETYEIEMSKAYGRHDIDKLEYGGLRVTFKARKNSLGPSRKSMTAELLWWQAANADGVMKQQFAWDWNTATIELLFGFETMTGKKTVFKALREITGITCASKSGRTAYSEKLGIPRDQPQLYRLVAAELEKRPDILDEVYKVIGITKRAPFQPGVDYTTLLNEAQASANAAGNDLYGEVEDLPEVAGIDPTDDVTDATGPTGGTDVV